MIRKCHALTLCQNGDTRIIRFGLNRVDLNGCGRFRVWLPSCISRVGTHPTGPSDTSDLDDVNPGAQ